VDNSSDINNGSDVVYCGTVGNTTNVYTGSESINPGMVDNSSDVNTGSTVVNCGMVGNTTNV
jgi:hypothetical protein